MNLQELFIGSNLSHGIWDPGGKLASTKQGPATAEVWKAHLDGKIGVGICPARPDGTCCFGAIDIDIDTIDHVLLYKEVQRRHMPLHVCRSKSGGAHLYVFMQEPGLRSSVVSATLKKWAIALGHPRAEIFPKQSEISVANFGSWINIPYFASDESTRYCVNGNGRIDLETFTNTITWWQGSSELESPEFIDDVPLGTQLNREELPPCLKTLTKTGISAGQRNVILFNMGIFFKKSQKARWEEALTEFNKEEGVPPLPYSELRAVIKSINNKGYQYQCNQEPLTSNCNRAKCLSLQYGIGSSLFNEDGAYANLVLSKLRKIDSEPPLYIICVNDADIDTTYEALLNQREFGKLVGQKLNIIPKQIGKEAWHTTIHGLLRSIVTIPAPKTASAKGQLIQKLHEFLSTCNRSINREDILKGSPLIEDDKILFRISDLQRHLANYGTDTLSLQEIFSAISQEGGDFIELDIKGKHCECWRFPLKNLNTQKEEFTQEEKVIEKEF